ncbi:epithelial-stromal interaction protein 1 [Parambassis ranga]|uniref:Epithelial-stromal interaction protein 1 n=1 Tax=Parambassis ranga TaxID=210632 RepID=A0A6P7H419_9TELE|nr:epithelial-stromal interaction protein 1 [Parambassis ranga]
MMDPYQNQRGTREQLNAGRNASYLSDSAAGASGAQTPVDRGDPQTANPPPADRQPRYSGGYTVIPPNESRRNEIKMTAQKDEEVLQRWRETNRVQSVAINPEKLGGHVTQFEARERQFRDLKCSKIQKKLKKEEMDKRRRQEEEEELQRMKAEQREKAERLEERRRRDEQRRSEQLRQDHLRKTENFLQELQSRTPRPQTSTSATHTPLRDLGDAPKSTRNVELEHKRVNAAFLDKLEGQGKEKTKERVADDEGNYVAAEDFGQQTGHYSHLNPDPEQSSGLTGEAEPDYDWALMKLINSFPDCNRDFLEDILYQCSGDYEQAYTLLICTLN